MNWAQFKDSFGYLGLPGAVVAFWFLTQESAGPSTFNDKYFLSLISQNSVKPFRKHCVEVQIYSPRHAKVFDKD